MYIAANDLRGRVIPKTQACAPHTLFRRGNDLYSLPLPAPNSSRSVSTVRYPGLKQDPFVENNVVALLRRTDVKGLKDTMRQSARRTVSDPFALQQRQVSALSAN